MYRAYLQKTVRDLLNSLDIKPGNPEEIKDRADTNPIVGSLVTKIAPKSLKLLSDNESWKRSADEIIRH